MSTATGDCLLTIEDLAARWRVGEDVIRRHVKDDGLPFVPLGRSQGRRPQYRFRKSAVERWEADRERVRERPEVISASVPPPAGQPLPGLDGKARTRWGAKQGRGAKP